MTLQQVKEEITKMALQSHKAFVKDMAEILSRNGFLDPTEYKILLGPLVCKWMGDTFGYEYEFKLEEVE